MSKLARDALKKLKAKTSAKEKYERVVVYLEPDDAERITLFCQKHEISKAAMFRKAAEIFMLEAEKH